MAKLLSAQQVADQIGVSAKTIRRLHKAGKIPALCISDETSTVKHYRFILEVVIQALKDRTDK